MQNKYPYKIWQPLTVKRKMQMKSILAQQSELMVSRCSFQDNLAAAGYSDGHVRVYNLTTENKISEMDANVHEVAPVNALRWRPQLEHNSSILLVANTHGHLYQVAAKTGKVVWHQQEEGNYIMAVDYEASGRQFASAGKDNTIRIYDEETKQVVSGLAGIKWQAPGHNNRIFSVRFKDDEPGLLASGGWDLNVHVWDLRTATVITTLYGPKIAGDAVDLFGNLVLTGANRAKNQLQLWDWRKVGVVQDLVWDQTKEESNNFVFCAQFCKSNKSNVMAVGGNELKVYSVEDKSELLRVTFDPAAIGYTCDSAYNSTKYLCGGKQGALCVLTQNKGLQ